jgi:hypothetical protein
VILSLLVVSMIAIAVWGVVALLVFGYCLRSFGRLWRDCR